MSGIRLFQFNRVSQLLPLLCIHASLRCRNIHRNKADPNVPRQLPNLSLLSVEYVFPTAILCPRILHRRGQEFPQRTTKSISPWSTYEAKDIISTSSRPCLEYLNACAPTGLSPSPAKSGSFIRLGIIADVLISYPTVGILESVSKGTD